jgi:hypothetical protein
VEGLKTPKPRGFGHAQTSLDPFFTARQEGPLADLLINTLDEMISLGILKLY